MITTKLYLIQVLTGLHCGVGQGGNDIDLPTARDAVTGHPIAPGSSLKGVLRDAFDLRIRGGHVDRERFNSTFGPDTKNAAEYASCVSFGDSHIVCLAVRSYKGTFAYLTSPIALRGFGADLKRAGLGAGLPDIPKLKEEENEFEIAVTRGSKLVIPSHNKVLLEEMDLVVADSRTEADAWADKIAMLLPATSGRGVEKAFFKSRFAIVADEVFDFLCETALPVVAHNAIDENGTVKNGALWYEEHLPSETILAGLLHAEDSRRSRGNQNEFKAKGALDFLAAKSLDIQLGGKATTGKGIVALTFPAL